MVTLLLAALLVVPQANDIAAGESLFFGKAGCAACHEVNGRGGIVGPELSNAGRLPIDTLRAKLLNPDAPIVSGRGSTPPQVLVATTANGAEIRGVRRNEDTFSVQIVDAAGALHALDKLAL